MMIGQNAHFRVTAENTAEFESLMAEFDIPYAVRSENVQGTVSRLFYLLESFMLCQKISLKILQNFEIISKFFTNKYIILRFSILRDHRPVCFHCTFF